MTSVKLWAAVPFALMLAGSAHAADLSPAAPAPIEQMPGSAPIINWSGFYIGGQAGYGFGSADATFANSSNTATDTSPSGWLFGLQAGYNWQFRSGVVIGVEGDYLWGSHTASLSNGGAGGGPVTIAQSIGDIGAIKGRLGWSMGQLLPYVTGGFAWSSGTRTETGNFPGSDNHSHSGYIVGAGLEYALNQRWSIRGEYDYVDLGSQNYNVPGPGGGGTNVHLTESLATVGLNYRF